MLTMPSERAFWVHQCPPQRTLIKYVLAFVLCSSTVLHNSQSVTQDNGVGETLLSAAQTLHDLVLIGPAV